MFTRIGTLTLALALVTGFSLGCDNRTKTEKAVDAAKEKLKEWKTKAADKLAELKSQKEFVDAAEEKTSGIKAKINELVEKAKKENPEAAKKIDAQVTALKKNLSEAEDAIKKAAAEPEKTWESVKAKAIDALKKAEAEMQGLQ